MNAPTGRRERKKAQTRKALADAALELFLDRGYDQVGVKDVADAADVSVTTLFKHFPCKEALVFDLDQDIEAALVAAVRERAPGVSVPQALREHLLTAVSPHTLGLSPHTLIPHPPGEQTGGRGWRSSAAWWRRLRHCASTHTGCGCVTKQPWPGPSPGRPAPPRTTPPAPPWPASP
ncbi:TetR/AcrR family transcriptional regulator [Streptomyces syringium]|uniref:TetR/AcrR family transcriptional regulator n=1 Tax=Streptomyces syringium TaxID=76729 RepID=UPI003D9181E4